MKYNFYIPVVTLEGTPLKEQYADNKEIKEREVIIGKLVASQLASSNDEDPLKMMIIAQNMYTSKEPIELDDADKAKIEKFITENKQLINLVRAQALAVLNNPVKE